MGWASGSELLGDVVLSTQKVVPKRFRKELYKLFINHFEQFDCDTIDECKGLDPLFDEALKELYPDWENDND
jgi:hypothetical protein